MKKQLRYLIPAILAGTLSLSTLSACTQKELINRATSAAIGAGVGLIQGQLLSTAQEIEMGEKIRLEIYQQYELYQGSDELIAYVRSIGEKVAANAERKEEINFRFDILNSDEINAFAIPGGGIFITTESLRYMKNEAELASVLGHEISHIDKKHSLNSLRQVMVAEGLLSGTFGKQDPELLKKAAELTLGLIIRGSGREQEKEADIAGADLALAQNYDEQSLLGFLETLRKVQGESPSGIIGFLMTHPGTDDRLRLLQQYFLDNHVNIDNPIINQAIFKEKTKILGSPTLSQ